MQEKSDEFYATWDAFTDEERAAKVKLWNKKVKNAKEFIEHWFGWDGHERD